MKLMIFLLINERQGWMEEGRKEATTSKRKNTKTKEREENTFVLKNSCGIE
jgi:hypothetical protein